MKLLVEKALRKALTDPRFPEANNPFTQALLQTVESSSGLPTARVIKGILKAALIKPESIIAHRIEEPEPQYSETTNELSIEDAQDWRITHLLMKGVKRYDVPNGADYYGLDFTESDKPASTVILGNNGVGKSSCFVALEWAGLGATCTGEFRGVKNVGLKTDVGEESKSHSDNTNEMVDLKKLESYLCNYHTITTEIGVTIRNCCKEYTVDMSNFGDGRIPYSFYNSAYDINVLAIDGITSDYLSRQLGLKALDDLCYLLDRMNVHMWKDERKYVTMLHNLSKTIFRKSVWEKIANGEYTDLQCTKWRRVLHRNLFKPEGFKGKVNALQLPYLKQLKDTMAKESGALADCDLLLPYYKELLANLDNIEDALFGKDANITVSEVSDNLSQSYKKLYEHRLLLSSILSLIYGYGEDKEERINHQYKIALSQMNTTKNNLAYLENAYPWVGKTNGEDWVIALSSALEELYNDFISQHTEKVQPIVDRLFEDFHEDFKELKLTPRKKYRKSGRPDEKKFTEILDARLVMKNGNNSQTPALFFNTFRFKLFCVTLKIALACSVMKQMKINYPIIIDDMFESSDFNNRVNIDRLIENIYKAHKDIMKDEPEELRNLQLIFFTQDEVIAEGVVRALQRAGEEGMPEEIPYKFARLYAPEEICKDIERGGENNETIYGESDLRYVTIDGKGMSYFKLLDTIR